MLHGEDHRGWPKFYISTLLSVLAVAFSPTVMALQCASGQIEKYTIVNTEYGPFASCVDGNFYYDLDDFFTACSAQIPGRPDIYPPTSYTEYNGVAGTFSQTAHDSPTYYFFTPVADVNYSCLALQYFAAVPKTPPPAVADSGCNAIACNNPPDPVTPSSGSEYLSEPDISSSSSGALSFSRAYNSLDTNTQDLSANWRHTYSRALVPEYSYPQYQPPYPKESSLYGDAGTACTSGWNEIRAQAPGLQSTTASYTNNTCTLSNGTTIGIYDNRGAYENVPPVLTAVHATRDDGHVLNFTVGGSGFLAEPGIGSRLASISGGYQLTDENDAVETYDSTGKLLSIAARGGYTQTLSYQGPAAVLSSVTDSFGRTLSFGYDHSNRLSSVTDPNGAITQYAYDSNGHLSTVTRPDSSVRQYLYNDPNWATGLSGVIDENGQTVFSLSYDTMGRVLTSQLSGVASAMHFSYSGSSTTDTDPLPRHAHLRLSADRRPHAQQRVSGSHCTPCGYSQAISYDNGGFPASVTDYNGNLTTYSYDDSRGLELSRTEASGTALARTISTTYSPNYRLPTEIDEPGRKTTFSYDSSGNLLTKTLTDTATARTWTYSNYTAWGAPQTIDGPRTDVSDVTQIAYYNCTSGSQCGQVQTLTDALGHVTSFNSYDASGRPLTITDPNGLVTTLSYYSRGWLKTRTVGSEVTSYTYDNAGQTKTINWPDGTALSFTYDAAHRLTDVYDQLNNHVHYTLDAMGNRTGTDLYDANSVHVQTHSAIYDSLNRLQQDIGAYANETTQYVYDNNANLTSITDPNNHQTVRGFDALNRLYKLTDPNNGITSLSLNSLDQTTAVTDPRSLATHYTVDALSNVTTLQSPDTGTTVSTYDAAGNLLTSKDALNLTTSYTYDVLNRLTKTTHSDGSIDTFSYDQGTYGIGHLTGFTDASGSTAYSYDQRGHLLTKTTTVAGHGPLTQYTYDAASGHLTQLRTPSGNLLNYTWTNGQISAIALGSTNLISSIVYQPFGGPKSWTLGNGEAISRSYDLDGRIAGTPLGTISYDPASRITAMTYGGFNVLSGSRSIGYDVLDRVTSHSGSGTNYGYGYDASGNLISRTTGSTPATYTISPTSNRIASTTQSGTTTNYSYDADGKLLQDANLSYQYNAIQRLTAVNHLGSYSYVYNALKQRATRTLPGSGLSFFVYGESGQMIGEYNSNGSLIEETVWLGELPVAMLKTGANYYIHADQTNTPRQIDDASGHAVWSWDQITYGNNQPNQDPRNTGTQFVYNLRGPGQYFDSGSGSSLFQNYLRDYDPRTGRYVESDPIGMGGGINTYAYVEGNPLKYVDRFGLAGSESERDLVDEAEGADPIVLAQYMSLLNQIQRYNPDFEDVIMSRPGSPYNRADVQRLEQALRDQQNQNSCPASTPVGRRGFPLTVQPDQTPRLTSGGVTTPVTHWIACKSGG